ncbi:hypothetical protein SAMN05421504_11626 [Amycolatopsis xylanica]|uniref:Glycosyl transferase family 2 n=1 Tax=Amycolatopsis xylanica TaxID=589385 RepID=A0A1H3SWU2_9PSEU|nr:hypothetical protein [Amycolatopsis xylanica]SDZ42394.1 hypothetical protein SAMN05421504_11626 [Amycolatopsis xylanica]
MNQTLVTPGAWDVASGSHHQGSHLPLLNRRGTTATSAAGVDAIIVPTARFPEQMHTAVAAAARLNCTLVVLCSKRASAARTAELAEAAGVELISVDVEVLPDGLLPEFHTTRLLRGTRFARRTDTGRKRNLGLLLARSLGWQRVVFLDDDIFIPRMADLTDAVRLLDRYANVGLSITGFPDNSVVCHANRYSGGSQEMFIGGGALAISAESFESFFPDIYNEDWFFLLDDHGLRPSGVVGTAVQGPYDPFLDTERARSEEFGDALAEGVFARLDEHRPLETDLRYWRAFLTRRRTFIREIVARIESAGGTDAERERVLAALKAAHIRSLLITAELCLDYLAALSLDRRKWRRHLRQAPTGLHPAKVLAELGLQHRGEYVPVSPRAF